MNKRRIAILGSTGSIGTQTLDVVRQHRDLFEVEMISANNNIEMLAAQAREEDGLTAIVFTSTLGVGVALSAVCVFVYQGLIALLAGWLSPVLTGAAVTEMGAAGGLLIAAIGLNMIYDKRIPVGNMLPAIFLPLAWVPLAALFR